MFIDETSTASYARAIHKSYHLSIDSDGIRTGGRHCFSPAVWTIFNAGNLRDDPCAAADFELSPSAGRRLPHGGQSSDSGQPGESGKAGGNQILPGFLFLVCVAGFRRGRVVHGWVRPDTCGGTGGRVRHLLSGIGPGERVERERGCANEFVDSDRVPSRTFFAERAER